MYDYYYGICDHFNNASPLSTVAFKKAEDYYGDSTFTRLVKTYVNYNINTIFGLSLDKFMNLTRCEIEVLLEIAKTKPALDNAAMDDIEKELLKK